MSLKTDVLQLSKGDNFSSVMLRLYAKSDPRNRAKIKAGWPNLVTVFEAWHTGPAIEVVGVDDDSHIPDLGYDD
ncbi:MAG: hypothetical protein IH888_04235 [Planctomycetes bacterium]|nr:hypothetical protein [Planctomycetota bacterium]